MNERASLNGYLEGYMSKEAGIGSLAAKAGGKLKALGPMLSSGASKITPQITAGASKVKGAAGETGTKLRAMLRKLLSVGVAPKGGKKGTRGRLGQRARDFLGRNKLPIATGAGGVGLGVGGAAATTRPLRNPSPLGWS